MYTRSVSVSYYYNERSGVCLYDNSNNNNNTSGRNGFPPVAAPMIKNRTLRICFFLLSPREAEVYSITLIFCCSSCLLIASIKKKKKKKWDLLPVRTPYGHTFDSPSSSPKGFSPWFLLHATPSSMIKPNAGVVYYVIYYHRRDIYYVFGVLVTLDRGSAPVRDILYYVH